MNQIIRKPLRTASEPEPTWEVAYLFPAQGQWTEAEYLALENNRLVEFSNGHLEVLPMPTTSHQLLVAYLYSLLSAFATSRDLGTALIAPLRVRLWRGKFREPDVVFMLKENASRIGEEYWDGADLVMEVVSEDKKDRQRDLEEKPSEYARGKISEYWIVDPREGKISVLQLAGKRYRVHGEFTKGDIATSQLLPDFAVDVTEALTHGSRPTAKAARKSRQKRKDGE